MSEITLFDHSFISPEVQAELPKGYTLRPLRSNDYERGFLKVLEVLTEVGQHTKAEWLGKKEQYIRRKKEALYLLFSPNRTIQLFEETQSRILHHRNLR